MSQPTPSPITLAGSLSLHPVGLGAALHEAGYEALGLPFRYVPFAVGHADLPGALTGMRALRIRGFGVSMPFKLEVIHLLDHVDPLAVRIGAVNTVVNEGGELSGFNTDAAGAAAALAEGLGPLGGRRVLVLGSGGAARAVAFGLAQEGAHVALAARDLARARGIAGALGASVLPWEEASRGGAGFDALVNATSVGMEGGGGLHSPVPIAALDPGLVLMDIVYRPIETELVRGARARGLRVVHGGRMLLHQAARQFELYTGRPAPLEAMAAALARELGAG